MRNDQPVRALMNLIAVITEEQAQAIAAAGDLKHHETLRQKASMEAWLAAYDSTEQSPWDDTWTAAFKAGVAPAATALRRRRASLGGLEGDAAIDSQEWQQMWSAVWHLTADAVAAESARYLISPELYKALIGPLRHGVGSDYPSSEGADNDALTGLS